MAVRSALAATALVALVALAGCASTASGDGDFDAMLGAMLSGQSMMQGKELEAALARADAFPLGSENNPVRAAGPSGQRAYLSRLRCSDLTAPEFERRGSVGDSPYGNIMDVYSVTCTGGEPAEAAVYMDMYHSGHSEHRAVPGFGIVGGQPGE